MSETTQTQQDAARVLVTLLGMDLPAAAWNLSDITPNLLEGQLDQSDRSGLDTWAEAFGVKVDWERHDGDAPAVFFTVGTAQVKVWSSFRHQAEGGVS